MSEENRMDPQEVMEKAKEDYKKMIDPSTQEKTTENVETK